MIRKIVIALLCGTFLLLGGYVGYRGYKVWKQQRLMNMARGFAEKADVRNAMLSVQQTLRLNPVHMEATRLAARLAEQVGSPESVVWLGRVVELNPRSLTDRLALAEAAIRFGDYRAATNALNGVDAAGKQTFGYHNVAGTLAALSNRGAEAEAHMLEAVRLEPSNPSAQMNLAVWRLNATNELDRAEAKLNLRRLSLNPTNPVVAVVALRELVKDALRPGGNKSNALELAHSLARHEKASFGDRIQWLEALRETRSAELPQALVAAQREAGEGTNSVAKVYQLAEWQMTRVPPRETLAWLETLPEVTRTNQPVAMMVADCLAELGQWAEQQNRLSSQNWEGLEFARHAYLSRALRNQKLDGAAKGEWELALKSANSQKPALAMLLRMAARWGWQSEGEEILWSIYNLSPGDRGAFEALTQVLYRTGRTRPLMMVLAQELKRSPTNLDVKNNLALAAMLLEAWELDPHTLAREAYAVNPTNASFASTRAYSLHLEGKHAEALEIMRSIDPTVLDRQPAMAGYYGLILKGAGEREAASKYLARVTNIVVLPEERKLFDAARAGL